MNYLVFCVIALVVFASQECQAQYRDYDYEYRTTINSRKPDPYDLLDSHTKTNLNILQNQTKIMIDRLFIAAGDITNVLIDLKGNLTKNAVSALEEKKDAMLVLIDNKKIEVNNNLTATLQNAFQTEFDNYWTENEQSRINEIILKAKEEIEGQVEKFLSSKFSAGLENYKNQLEGMQKNYLEDLKGKIEELKTKKDELEAELEKKKNDFVEELERKKNSHVDELEEKKKFYAKELEMKKDSHVERLELKKNFHLEELELKKNLLVRELEAKKNVEVKQTDVGTEIAEPEVKNESTGLVTSTEKPKEVDPVKGRADTAIAKILARQKARKNGGV